AFAFFFVASLGPVLHVQHREVVSMPWRAVSVIPIVSSMLPARFMLYGFLTAAVAVALWLASRTRTHAAAKWALVVVGALILFPDVRSSSSWWKSDISTPR